MCKEKCNEKSIDRRFHVNDLVNLIANGVELIWNKIHEMDGDCERKVEIYFCLECVYVYVQHIAKVYLLRLMFCLYHAFEP